MIFMIEVLLFALEAPTLGAFRAPRTSSRFNKAQRGGGAAKQEAAVEISRGQEGDCYATLVRSPCAGREKPLWRWERIETKLAAVFGKTKEAACATALSAFHRFEASPIPLDGGMAPGGRYDHVCSESHF
jgi:hypothetical protein